MGTRIAEDDAIGDSDVGMEGSKRESEGQIAASGVSDENDALGIDA